MRNYRYAPSLHSISRLERREPGTGMWYQNGLVVGDGMMMVVWCCCWKLYFIKSSISVSQISKRVESGVIIVYSNNFPYYTDITFFNILNPNLFFSWRGWEWMYPQCIYIKKVLLEKVVLAQSCTQVSLGQCHFLRVDFYTYLHVSIKWIYIHWNWMRCKDTSLPSEIWMNTCALRKDAWPTPTLYQPTMKWEREKEKKKMWKKENASCVCV